MSPTQPYPYATPAALSATGLPAPTSAALAAARVDLRALWLTDATNPAAPPLVLPLLAGGTTGWPASVTTTVMAKGRVRAARGPRAAQTWTPPLGHVDAATAWTLALRAGDPFWARDPLGGKVCCTWNDPVITWRGRESPTGAQTAVVALTLAAFTHAPA